MSTSVESAQRAHRTGAQRRPDHAPPDLQEPQVQTAAEAPEGAAGSALLILASLTVLVVIRFFSEVLSILPRFVNFVDIPIFALLITAALIRRVPTNTTRRRRGGELMFPAICSFVFLVVCAVSVLSNLSRVDLAPALVFLYGFLGPVALFFAVHRLWPTGSILKLSRLLVALGLVQIAIVFFIQLPQFISDEDPDVISGTFGENAYQLVFFLLLLLGLLAGIFTFERGRLAARVAPAMLVAILAVILLAQYRSLLLTTALTIALLGIILGPSSARGTIAAVFAGAALMGTLAYVVQNIPALKFGATIEDARTDPTFYFEKRLETTRTLERLYGDQPRFALTGSGPGTYSSRAWRTFAVTGDSKSDVSGEYVQALTNGRLYRTDVADKYVLPQLRSEIIGGSRAVTTPFSSYLSLLAEVGMTGFALMMAVYLWALLRALVMTRAAIRATVPGDPLPALACASLVAFFVLLQMAVFENWFEVSRITFMSWIVLAVVTKEFASRRVIA